MQYIIQFINTTTREEYPCRDAFNSMADLEAWVRDNYPGFTSFGVTVLAQ